METERPKSRWMNEVASDTNASKIANWKKKARNLERNDYGPTKLGVLDFIMIINNKTYGIPDIDIESRIHILIKRVLST